ncbi:MAG: molybdopterin oxidoreductase, partial [Planctomycetes bacterium]|nr:molybdopterin oxidoreductase [Planctomycetota bacterium]
ACHHCLEPACMTACPVDAYEKDPITGIVKHLDDQCFGCQYCTLACPYGVPKYHSSKGIVRKCDMCSSRLKAGEAPACVQACPHEAIAIRTVSIQKIFDDSEANAFLPAAPEPSMTLPTTTYRTKRVFPRNMLPADYYSINPEHPHWPLIVMLVLTQLSVGSFTVGCLFEARLTDELQSLFRPLHATNALILGLLALAASVFHLGRPLYAFRGILGWRHSWLSREIICFGMFATLAIPYAILCWIALNSHPLGVELAESIQPWLSLAGASVSTMGLLGLFCSIMIYVCTQRDLWSFERTAVRFCLSSALLGSATTWLSFLLLDLFINRNAAGPLVTAVGPELTRAVILFGTAKLLTDASLLRHLFGRRMTSLKRSALLVAGKLSTPAMARVALGVLGSVMMPCLLLGQLDQSTELGTNPIAVTSIIMTWIGCLGGELMERYLFFAAVSSPRMPGG